MTGSSITAQAANPAPSPEIGLISIRFMHSFLSIRSLDAGCPVFFTAQRSQARFLQPPLQQPQLLQPPLLQPQLQRPGTPGPRITRISSFVYRPSIRSSSFRDFFLLKNIRH